MAGDDFEEEEPGAAVKSPAGLPPLLTGQRRSLMAILVGVGLGQAAAAGASAFLMGRLLSTAGVNDRIWAIAGLLGAALCLGALRVLERIFAEKLGQHYVHQIRRGLVRSSLSSDRPPSIGITIARTTNDLSSVRNWIAQGIAPLTVGIPMLLGTAVALWFLSPPLAVAVVLPMCMLTLTLALLSRPALRRAGQLRRHRGRLAAHVSDIVAASTTIRAAGGEQREVRQVDKLGRQVARSAVARATIGGYIRGSAVLAASITVIAVAGTGSWLGIDIPTIAAALTVVGTISGPVTDLGRVVEFRQNFLAARNILGPALSAATAARIAEKERRDIPAVDAALNSTTIRFPGIELPDGGALPPLEAAPGSRIALVGLEPRAATELFESILGVRTYPQLRAAIGGRDLLELPSARRRAAVGYAARGASLERGTIARAIRYRRPDLPADVTGEMLERVGLTERVRQLPEGERTVLKRGGEPLSVPERARLQLARALLGEPPLLLLNHIDADLGRAGSALLARALETYPGVVLIASEHPEAIAPGATRWAARSDGTSAGAAVAPRLRMLDA